MFLNAKISALIPDNSMVLFLALFTNWGLFLWSCVRRLVLKTIRIFKLIQLQIGLFLFNLVGLRVASYVVSNNIVFQAVFIQVLGYILLDQGWVSWRSAEGVILDNYGNWN